MLLFTQGDTEYRGDSKDTTGHTYLQFKGLALERRQLVAVLPHGQHGVVEAFAVLDHLFGGLESVQSGLDLNCRERERERGDALH